eukprot:6200952-Pleurochrysis_carterae.AAC.2
MKVRETGRPEGRREGQRREERERARKFAFQAQREDGRTKREGWRRVRVKLVERGTLLNGLTSCLYSYAGRCYRADSLYALSFAVLCISALDRVASGFRQSLEPRISACTPRPVHAAAAGELLSSHRPQQVDHSEMTTRAVEHMCACAPGLADTRARLEECSSFLIARSAGLSYNSIYSCFFLLASSIFHRLSLGLPTFWMLTFATFSFPPGLGRTLTLLVKNACSFVIAGDGFVRARALLRSGQR